MGQDRIFQWLATASSCRPSCPSCGRQVPRALPIRPWLRAPRPPTTPRPPLLNHDVRNEAPPGRSRHWPNGERCRALSLEYDDAPPHAPAPPNATSNRWPRDASGSLAASGAKRYGTTAAGLPLFQLAWRPDAYNTLHVPLHRFGRCTGRTESCVGLHADCPPPPPPFDVVMASKKASSSKGSRRSRARASKPGAGGGAATRGL